MDFIRLKNAVEQIEMPKDMKERIIGRTLTARSGRIHKKRGPLILLAAAICFVLSVPVLAATTESAYQLLYQLSPAVAQFFQPVCRSDEDKGICMEVISARTEGNTVQVYIALRDLEGDRVDETTDLYDSYSIHRPFDSSAHCELAGYDEATGTAYFLVTITEYGNQNIIGDKITFSVREFLSHKQYYDAMKIPVDWSAVPNVTELWENVVLTGCGGLEIPEDEEQSLMIPNKNPLNTNVIKGINFTAIGFVDGKLHVQMAVENGLQNDNHGYVYLVDQEGNKVHASYSISAQDSSSGVRIDYQEQVFDVSADAVNEYRLMGDFVTSDQLTEGNWQVTFPIEQGEQNS